MSLVIQHHFVDNFVMSLIGQMIHKEDFMGQELCFFNLFCLWQ